MKTRRFPAACSLALAFAAMALAQSVRADSLADRAPADAVGFVSWAGSEALGKAYDGSHLKGLLEAMNLPAFLSQRFEEESNKGDAEAAADRKVGMDFLTTVVKSPSAFYFGPIDFADADQPKFKMAFYAQVGKEKAASLAGQLAPIVAKKHHEKDPPATVTAAGDYLLITIGSVPEMEKRLSGAAPADGLANVPAFQKTMGQIGAAAAPPAALMYIDGEAAINLLKDGIAAKGGMGAEMFPKVADAMGLTGIRRFGLAGNFDGANWSSQMFLGLDARRVGYMALLDSKPLPDETLKLIPKTAAWASVMRLDVARLMQDIRDGAAIIEPQNGPRGLDAGLQQFFAFTGVDLQKDIIDVLGDGYVLYSTPDAKGSTLQNAVIVSKPKDAAKLETSFTTIESVISAMIAQRAPNGVAFKTESLPAPNDKVTVHVISTPMVSPAWTVANGNFYLGFSLEGVQNAVENAGKNGSITENPKFVELWKKVGRKDMSAFSFIDYQQVITELYPMAVQALAAHQAAHPGEKNPFVLPPLEKLTANLSPSLGVYWTDADGFHVKSTGPLPVLDMARAESMLQVVAMGYFTTSKPAAAIAPVERNMP